MGQVTIGRLCAHSSGAMTGAPDSVHQHGSLGSPGDCQPADMGWQTGLQSHGLAQLVTSPGTIHDHTGQSARMQYYTQDIRVNAVIYSHLFSEWCTGILNTPLWISRCCILLPKLHGAPTHSH